MTTYKKVVEPMIEVNLGIDEEMYGLLLSSLNLAYLGAEESESDKLALLIDMVRSCK